MLGLGEGDFDLVVLFSFEVFFEIADLVFLVSWVLLYLFIAIIEDYIPLLVAPFLGLGQKASLLRLCKWDFHFNVFFIYEYLIIVPHLTFLIKRNLRDFLIFIIKHNSGLNLLLVIVHHRPRRRYLLICSILHCYLLLT